MIEEYPKSSSGTLLQFSYRNREGKSLKSAKEVKQQVDDEGRLEEFVSNATKNQNQVRKLRFRLSNDLLSSDETYDSDYEPPKEKQTLKEIKHNKRWVFICIIIFTSSYWNTETNSHRFTEKNFK